MKEILLFILMICVVFYMVYTMGKFFAKGLLKEIDLFLGKKFTDYINNKSKKEEDGNKEKTE